MQHVVISLQVLVLVAIRPLFIEARWLKATTAIPVGTDAETGDSVLRPGSTTDWTDWNVPVPDPSLRNFYEDSTPDGCFNDIIREPGAMLQEIIYWRYDVNHSLDEDEDNEIIQEAIEDIENQRLQQGVQSQIMQPQYGGGAFQEEYRAPPAGSEGRADLSEQDSGIFGYEADGFKRLARRSPQNPDPLSEESKSDTPRPNTNNPPVQRPFRQLNYDDFDTAPIELPSPINEANNPFNQLQFNANPSIYQPQLQPLNQMQNNPMGQSYGGYIMQRMQSLPTEPADRYEARPYNRNEPTGQQPRAFRRLTFNSDNEAPTEDYSRIDLRPTRNQAEMITFEEGVQLLPGPGLEFGNGLRFNNGPPTFQPLPQQNEQPNAFRRLNFDQEEEIRIEDPQGFLNTDLDPQQTTQNVLDFLNNDGQYLDRDQPDPLLQEEVVESLSNNDDDDRLFIVNVGSYGIGGDISFRFVIDRLDPNDQQYLTLEEAVQLLENPSNNLSPSN
ncbi:hypothetical protein Dda_2256 [Drechslerella dactyloides]|uniref:Uncharacterized protein n=1 Tax=Drechslerella dactyloides TaxID=74499 RepID=A0AAD6J4J9_DREDA|nr:hypothetical protein Dda_2256 [Drechslerella dactyloides]